MIIIIIIMVRKMIKVDSANKRLHDDKPHNQVHST